MPNFSHLQATLTPHHICIQTNDYFASKNFYIDILGFSLIEETPNFNGRAFNSWLEKKGFYIELQTPKQNKVFETIHTELSGINHFCFYTPFLEALFLEFEKNYPHYIIKPIYTVFSTQLFKIKAPEGTMIEFRNTLS